jgi:hypothetical protein
MTPSQAVELADAWARAVRETRFDSAKLPDGLCRLVGSLLLQYDAASGQLIARGVLFTNADKLKNVQDMLWRLEDHASRFPDLLESARLEYLSAESTEDMSARIVLRVDFDNRLPADLFIDRLRRLSASAYAWRQKHVGDAILGRG